MREALVAAEMPSGIDPERVHYAVITARGTVRPMALDE